LWSFGVFSPFLVCCIKINLATLISNDNLLLAGVIKRFWLHRCTFFGPRYSKNFGILSVLSTQEPVHRNSCRVARWFVFKPKIPILVNFGRPWSENFWYILWSFGLFHIHLVYFMYVLLVCFAIIWNIFPQFGMLHREKSGNPE
jgi:hypothetical protein